MTWKKAYLGVIAGAFTIIIFSIDRIEFISTMYNGVLSYSLSLPMLVLIGAVSFMGGLKREFTACITYISSMILYDLLTNDLRTVLFAGVSTITLIIGATISVLVSWRTSAQTPN